MCSCDLRPGVRDFGCSGKRKRSGHGPTSASSQLERETGLEPATLCLRIRCTPNVSGREVSQFADHARKPEVFEKHGRGRTRPPRWLCGMERLERGTGFEPATSCLEGTEQATQVRPMNLG